MKTFFDSSALVKRYIAEHGSDAADNLCEATDELAVCVICIPEIISALNRRLREKALTRADYVTVKSRLLDDARDAKIVNLSGEVLAYATLVLEQTPIRAMDALHIAAAKAWNSDLFVTADKAQARAAHRMGLKHQTI